MKKKLIGIFVCTLLIASTSTVMLVIGQPPHAHDVGVTSIISPVNGPGYEGIPLKVALENFGTNDEYDVTITVDIDRLDPNTWTWVDECTHSATTDINDGSSFPFLISDWTPDFFALEATGQVQYRITACTDLEDPPDDDPGNDCKSVTITLDFWHDVGVASIETCKILGTRPVYAVFENLGTFPEDGLTANIKITDPDGVKICDMDKGNIILDEPLGGTKEINLGNCDFTQVGTYQIIVCIMLIFDDYPSNNCKTVSVEIVSIGMFIDDLIALLNSMGLDTPVLNSLIAQLISAKNALPNEDVAITHLNTFLTLVNHWSTYPPLNPGLTAAQATLLTDAAQAIIDLINNPCP